MTDSPVDALAEFREAVTGYVTDAKKKLETHDVLEPLVLLGGVKSFVEVDIGPMPMPLVRQILRNLCGTYPDIEYAVHISLAYVLTGETHKLPSDNIQEHKGARLCVIVHASHRDLGLFAAHVPFIRKAEKQFEFSETEWPDVKLLREETLSGLWAARQLNS